MRRYEYRHNGEWANLGRMFELVPVYFKDVAPGESLRGAINNHVITARVVKAAMNALYLECWAFYVPYRLLWTGWEDFIREGTGTVPTISSTSGDAARMYIRSITNYTANEFPVRAYNMIWNKFFRSKNVAEVAEGSQVLQRVGPKTGSFDQALSDVAESHFTDVTVASATQFTVRDLHAKEAEQRWQNLRGHYGDRYVDFLRAVGVEPGWALLEEPELLGRGAKRMFYASTPRTDTDAGTIGGSFKARCSSGFKRRMFVEHGLVVGLCAVRGACTNISAVGSVAYSPTDRSEFYSPEFETEDIGTYEESLLGENTTGNAYAPKYEHHRVPENCMSRPATLGVANTFLLTIDDAALTAVTNRQRDPDDFDTFFGSELTATSPKFHYQVVSNQRLTAMSPVRPTPGPRP